VWQWLFSPLVQHISVVTCDPLSVWRRHNSSVHRWFCLSC